MPIDSKKSILYSARQLFSGTVLSRISGMLRDMSMAAAFGSHPAVAALMVAFRFSNLLRRLFGEGALHSAFVPQFEALRSQDPKRAGKFFRDLSFALMVFLIIFVCLVECILFACLFFFDFSPENKEILYLTVLMFPSIPFICHFGLNNSFLQCEKEYFIGGIAPLAFNVVWIIAVFFLRNCGINQAMSGLAMSIVIACCVQYLVTLPRSIQILSGCMGVKFWRSISLRSRDMKGLMKPLLFGIMGVGASQVNGALDAIFARYADLEGPAYLWYAIRIQQLPLALFSLAMSSALLPPLSRAIKENKVDRYLSFLCFSIRYCIEVMLLAFFGVLVLGPSLVVLLYGRGGFDDVAAYHTTLCLWSYVLGLLPMALIFLLGAAFYAKGRFLVPMRAAMISVFLNILLNAVMVFFLKMGAESIALATSCSAWINCYLLIKSLEENVLKELSKLKMQIMKVFGVCFLAALLTWGGGSFLWREQVLWMFNEEIFSPFSPFFFEQVKYFSFQGLCFLGGVFLLGGLFKVSFEFSPSSSLFKTDV